MLNNKGYLNVLTEWNSLSLALIQFLEAEERVYEKNLDYDVIVKTGYSELFIDNIIFVDDDHKSCISPTVCHHVYNEFSNSSVQNMIIYSENICGRKGDFQKDLSHVPIFYLQEFVIIGSREFVEEKLDKCTNKIVDIFRYIFSNMELKIASDSFFSNPNREILKMMQENSRDKQEIVVNGTSICSINRLGNKYGVKCEIKQENSNDAIHSACIGIGQERLMAAINSLDRSTLILKLIEIKEGLLNNGSIFG